MPEYNEYKETVYLEARRLSVPVSSDTFQNAIRGVLGFEIQKECARPRCFLIKDLIYDLQYCELSFKAKYIGNKKTVFFWLDNGSIESSVSSVGHRLGDEISANEKPISFVHLKVGNGTYKKLNKVKKELWPSSDSQSTPKTIKENVESGSFLSELLIFSFSISLLGLLLWALFVWVSARGTSRRSKGL